MNAVKLFLLVVLLLFEFVRLPQGQEKDFIASNKTNILTGKKPSIQINQNKGFRTPRGKRQNQSSPKENRTDSGNLFSRKQRNNQLSLNSVSKSNELDISKQPIKENKQADIVNNDFSNNKKTSINFILDEDKKTTDESANKSFADSLEEIVVNFKYAGLINQPLTAY